MKRHSPRLVRSRCIGHRYRLPADPAHAKRFHRFDTTDAEIKAYCSQSNALQKSINWPASIGLTLGPACNRLHPFHLRVSS